VRHGRLGLSYAGLGRKEEAIREGREAVRLLPVSEDAYEGPMHRIHLAMVHAMVGEHEAALDELEFLLAIPSHISAPLLRIDPL
jgi:hypothetical protein